MDPAIRAALDRGHTIDITTTGRRSHQPRRIEIVFHNIDGRLYISGIPSRRTRAWIHNLEDDPNLTVHLKDRTATADLPATARVITDEPERRAVDAAHRAELGSHGRRHDGRVQPADRGHGPGLPRLTAAHRTSRTAASHRVGRRRSSCGGSEILAGLVVDRVRVPRLPVAAVRRIRRMLARRGLVGVHGVATELTRWLA